MLQTQNIHKLSTREDAYNIHKTLGIACFLNFVYRYTQFFIYGNMGLENSAWTLVMHGALSCSSLLFHISTTRNPVKPIIYREFRMHSILFAMRSVVVCALYYYHFHYGYIIGTCYSVLFLSDLITNTYNKEKKMEPLCETCNSEIIYQKKKENILQNYIVLCKSVPLCLCWEM